MLRMSGEDHLDLLLQMGFERFQIFGGWMGEYYTGIRNATSEYGYLETTYGS